jgi:hypothetical protein
VQKLPDDLVFIKRSSRRGWSYLPERSKSLPNTFFLTPIYASEKALQVYGKAKIIAFVEVLRKQAKELEGIAWFQIIYHRKDKYPSLLIIEESNSGDHGLGIIYETDLPLRTIVLLADEIWTYSFRYGWEWTEMTKLAD